MFVKQIVDEIFSISPEVQIDYKIDPKLSLAEARTDSDWSSNSHTIIFKNNNPRIVAVLHELIHIKNSQTRRQNYYRILIDEPNTASAQLLICFSSMYDHYCIHQFLVNKGLINDDVDWVSFSKSFHRDSKDNQIQIMDVYCLCSCINEAGSYLKKYRKKLSQTIPNTFGIVNKIMEEHNIGADSSEEQCLMDLRRKIKNACDVIPGLGEQFRNSFSIKRVFSEEEKEETISQCLHYSRVKNYPEPILGLYYKKDVVPFLFIHDCREIIELLNEKKPLGLFLDGFGYDEAYKSGKRSCPYS